MTYIKIDLSNLRSFVSDEKIQSLQKEIDLHYPSLWNKTGKGSDFLGWADLRVKRVFTRGDSI